MPRILQPANLVPCKTEVRSGVRSGTSQDSRHERNVHFGFESAVVPINRICRCTKPLRAEELTLESLPYPDEVAHDVCQADGAADPGRLCEAAELHRASRRCGRRRPNSLPIDRVSWQERISRERQCAHPALLKQAYLARDRSPDHV